ncbi:MAG: tRNA pseudouridine(38-40) synthase TruA [Muribaculaceae bacterium]|nr:tRNA pseudouridine(38-40) synthase TruA [Muribaculaceae bacterium]
MRYFLRLAYRGAPYHGWQTQPNADSVQQTIERALELALRRPTPIVGAGRTDTGVNASMMYAHFDTDTPITDKKGLLRALNSICGPDIVLQEIIDVPADAHARFDATSRTYYYWVHTAKSPFLYPLSWQAPASLDFELMNSAAEILLSVSDFTSFAKLHSDAKTNICHVTRAEWVQTAPDRWVFIITADRFLRNMVRAVVGTLVDVGRHKLTIEQFRDVISRRDRCAAGTSMPPHPLFLHSVTYPYIETPETDLL